jgi:hypothetical protein
MNTAVWPEKLYTQQEVDTIKRQAEVQTADQKIEDDSRTVANLVKKSNRILLSISSHAFPIDIFPDTINIEEGRITIINRHFLSSEVHSIDIKDISNVFINTTLFFSQLVVISKTFEENEIKIRNLRTGEAIFARRIIEGLRTFVSKKIDTSSYTKEDLVAKLEELSTTEIVT